METIFLIIHVFIALILIILVLVQKSSSDGFGLGSGSGMNLLGSRGAANLLTRSTAIVATLFICNSLFLSVLASNRTANDSILDKIDAVNAGKMEGSDVNIEPVENSEDAAKAAADVIPEVPQVQDAVEAGKAKIGATGDAVKAGVKDEKTAVKDVLKKAVGGAKDAASKAKNAIPEVQQVQ